MIKKYLASTLLSLSLSTTCLAASVDDIRWIGQDYFPYSYMENNQREGMAVEVVAAILKKMESTKTTKDIEIKAFSRSFIRKNNDQNTVFFPLAKLPEREKYFKWIGPIAMDEPVLFAKKSKNITINGATDLAKYSIAAKDGYGAVKLLKNLGVKDSSIDVNESDMESIEKVVQEKVDLLACNRLTCIEIMKDRKVNPHDYNIVYKMQGSELSLAVNKDTDKELFNKLTQAFEEVKKSKEFSEISNRYLK